MKNTTIHFFKPFFFFAVPFIFILGSLLHFAYNLSNQNLLVALIAPINESIWEHTKLVFVPTVLWYILYLRFSKKSWQINQPQWYTACLISVVTGIAAIPLLFYFYTQAFGIERLWIDVLLLFIAALLGQTVAWHSYKYSFSIKPAYIFAALCIIWAIYILFTLIPPDLPIFISRLN